ncbi:MAG: hypothetical protein HY814_03230 [Candidatus Riflebacteria bacterium]|nr:hypothetical protein [Candidatus Riflebacteria bacterium]
MTHSLYARGSYQDQLAFLEAEIARLRNSLVKAPSTQYQRFFQDQINAVVPLRDDLAKKKSLSEIERELIG